MRPVVYAIGGTERTRHVAAALRAGFEQHGIDARVRTHFAGVEGDIALAYGWNHEPVFTAYRLAGRHYAYFDMGYWDRRPHANKKDGFHRLAVDAWDTRDKMLRGCPDDRFRTTRPPTELSPWLSRGQPIIVAGMSAKAAGTHGFQPGQWEAKTEKRLRAITDRPLIHRAKPVGERPPGEPIEALLDRAHMVVSHHSNTAVDAMIAGVPFFASKGVGAILSPPKLTAEFVASPPHIALLDRVALLSDIAYAQWRPSEMRTGIVWDYIKCILSSS